MSHFKNIKKKIKIKTKLIQLVYKRMMKMYLEMKGEEVYGNFQNTNCILPLALLFTNLICASAGRNTFFS